MHLTFLTYNRLHDPLQLFERIYEHLLIYLAPYLFTHLSKHLLLIQLCQWSECVFQILRRYCAWGSVRHAVDLGNGFKGLQVVHESL